jgi:hypothetical protein
MLTMWFLVGALIAGFITILLYFAARELNSVSVYAGMIIVPLILNIVVWVILYLLVGVSYWYLVGATLAIFFTFAVGLASRFISQAWAYLITFIIPLLLCIIAWILISIFIELWGVYNV